MEASLNREALGYDASSARIYSGMADGYGYATDRDVPGRLKVELLRRYLGPGDVVLDLGCANGLHLCHAARLCERVVGVDVSERMLLLARQALADQGLENAEVMRANGRDLPFEDESFDVVYCYSTLPWVADLHGVLNEIVRVLRTQGTAILDVAGRWNLSRRHWNRWYREQGHFGVHSMSWSQLAHALDRRNLEPFENHATGAADQWRYLRGAHHLRALERIVHGPGARDLDYRLSNLPGARLLANRWYVAARKTS